jgi:hypothetical protein
VTVDLQHPQSHYRAPARDSARVAYGLSRLADALAAIHADVAVSTGLEPRLGPEGFHIRVEEGKAIALAGGDESGLLYACLELAGRVQAGGRLPQDLNFADAPAMALRGPCIGLQKTFILPGRRVYEYPYTPELFPFFYDEGFWCRYLDRLVELRMNTLYLWNGHPFASLVRVPGYEYAVEVPEDVFDRNVRMFRFITRECDRRGIWLLQKFYSILLPQPLAQRHGLDTQLAAPVPVASDYTRKAIAGFVEEYPSVGLLVCLGEALQGLDHQTFWLREVVLGGVRDGMRAAGLRDEPPVVVRAHATDPGVVLPPALEVYGNLYTMAKYNGESLTTDEPRGVRQQVHLAMSRLGRRHVANVHILANLEPFRFGAQRFIRQCVQAARKRLGANGLHLYPLAFWSWPDAPDEADPPLDQLDRDWMWYEAWARYAWSPEVEAAEDRDYWLARLAERYGSRAAAADMLDAVNDAGECAPRILRRFGITEGNRQTMSLGMTLDQLTDPQRFRPFPELWESQSPPGERLGEYVEREMKGGAHEGETPPQIIEQILAFSARATEAIDRADSQVRKNRAEFDRLRNDVHCIAAMCRFYSAKAMAAMAVLRYRHTRELREMQAAAAHLGESVDHFRRLAELTRRTYRFANTMQTSQRRIPFPGGAADGTPINYHWSQVLPHYESELAAFKERVQCQVEGGGDDEDETGIASFVPAAVRVLSPHAQTYTIAPGAGVYTDRPYRIQSVAKELVGLTGIRFAHTPAKEGAFLPIEFEVDEPVLVLIGYFQDPRPIWLQVPDLETDAAAIDQLDAEPLLLNAATIDSVPAVHLHAMRFPAGRSTLAPRGRGSFVVLGVIPASSPLRRRDARRGGAE